MCGIGLTELFFLSLETPQARDPKSSRFIKISERYGCADIGAVSHWSTHKTVILAIYTADNLAGDDWTTLSSPPLLGSLAM